MAGDRRNIEGRTREFAVAVAVVNGGGRRWRRQVVLEGGVGFMVAVGTLLDWRKERT